MGKYSKFQPDKSVDRQEYEKNPRRSPYFGDGAGKGSWTRPREVSEDEYTESYCRTFGHQYRIGKCRNCGEPE